MGTPERYKFLPIRDAMKSIRKLTLWALYLSVASQNELEALITAVQRSLEAPVCRVDQMEDSPLTRGRGRPKKTIGETITSPNWDAVNIFTETSEGLPHIAANGDVIQLSNVVVKMHGGEVNAVFNKKSSSFALYTGKDTDDFVPYQVSKFHRRDMDKNFIVKLRKWLVNFHLSEDSCSFPMLREIKEGDNCNLACKVTVKFRCIVRVVAAMPWPAEKFCSPTGTYMMRLTLEDPTARIRAFAYDEDGVKTKFNLQLL